MKIKAYAIKPGDKEGRFIDIENELEPLQEFVDGYIETVTAFTNLVIICNEEGRLRNMDYCCAILGADFYGPVLIVGRSKDEFDDVPFTFEEGLRGLLGVK